jgi:hypothetical protein
MGQRFLTISHSRRLEAVASHHPASMMIGGGNLSIFIKKKNKKDCRGAD